MEDFLTRTARDVYEFLFDKGLPLELCDKIEGSYVILILHDIVQAESN